MYREQPLNETDSGWRFFTGNETQDYVDNHNNLSFYDVNTIVNYDISILPYLTSPIGTELSRLENSNTFIVINGSIN